MRYEKPMVMDLSARARATGQWPLGCYDGFVANAVDEVCFAGGTPSYTLTPCWAGDNPTDGSYSTDCIGGTSAYYCESGSGGEPDPNGCRSGPLVV